MRPSRSWSLRLGLLSLWLLLPAYLSAFPQKAVLRPPVPERLELLAQEAKLASQKLRGILSEKLAEEKLELRAEDITTMMVLIPFLFSQKLSEGMSPREASLEVAREITLGDPGKRAISGLVVGQAPILARAGLTRALDRAGSAYLAYVAGQAGRLAANGMSFGVGTYGFRLVASSLETHNLRAEDQTQRLEVYQSQIDDAAALEALNAQDEELFATGLLSTDLASSFRAGRTSIRNITIELLVVSAASAVAIALAPGAFTAFVAAAVATALVAYVYQLAAARLHTFVDDSIRSLEGHQAEHERILARSNRDLERLSAKPTAEEMASFLIRLQDRQEKLLAISTRYQGEVLDSFLGLMRQSEEVALIAYGRDGLYGVRNHVLQGISPSARKRLQESLPPALGADLRGRRSFQRKFGEASPSYRLFARLDRRHRSLGGTRDRAEAVSLSTQYPCGYSHRSWLARLSDELHQGLSQVARDQDFGSGLSEGALVLEEDLSEKFEWLQRSHRIAKSALTASISIQELTEVAFQRFLPGAGEVEAEHVVIRTQVDLMDRKIAVRLSNQEVQLQAFSQGLLEESSSREVLDRRARNLWEASFQAMAIQRGRAPGSPFESLDRTQPAPRLQEDPSCRASEEPLDPEAEVPSAAPSWFMDSTPTPVEFESALPALPSVVGTEALGQIQR